MRIFFYIFFSFQISGSCLIDYLKCVAIPFAPAPHQTDDAIYNTNFVIAAFEQKFVTRLEQLFASIMIY